MTLHETYKICGAFQEIKKLLKIILTQPVTSVEAERSFSTKWRLFTWLRSTMTTARLCSLALMNVHPSKVSEITNDDIKEDFLALGTRRLEFEAELLVLCYLSILILNYYLRSIFFPQIHVFPHNNAEISFILLLF